MSVTWTFGGSGAVIYGNILSVGRESYFVSFFSNLCVSFLFLNSCSVIWSSYDIEWQHTEYAYIPRERVQCVTESLLSVGFENALYEGKTLRRLTSMLSTLRIYCFLCESVFSHVKGFPYILAGSLVWL